MIAHPTIISHGRMLFCDGLLCCESAGLSLAWGEGGERVRGRGA